VNIDGSCDDRFAPVKDAFADNFESRGDLGASVAVSVEGEYLVDLLWGGHLDEDRQEPWREDTIINVYSTTKTMAAACALLLADRGEIDFYEPVKTYWPEFAQNGKGQVQVRHFMSHSAGLSGMDEPFSGEALYDWDAVVEALARQAPWWEPGTQSGYHALTQGHLIGEVVRRVTGQSIGTFYREEFAEPLGADFHIGTGEEHFHRIANMIPPEAGPDAQVPSEGIAARTFANPVAEALESRTPGWRKAEIPAANGHGNARSVVKVQSVLANGGEAFGKRVMSEAGCRTIFQEQSNGMDLVLGIPVRFGMGYGLNSDAMPLSPNPHTCYWGGWGGSIVIVDQDARMCVSYVMNRMEATLTGDMRGMSIVQAAYQSLANLT
jgi:CubicO group peptidase (beta-lactamase class C family)